MLGILRFKAVLFRLNVTSSICVSVNGIDSKIKNPYSFLVNFAPVRYELVITIDEVTILVLSRPKSAEFH